MIGVCRGLLLTVVLIGAEPETGSVKVPPKNDIAVHDQNKWPKP